MLRSHLKRLFVIFFLIVGLLAANFYIVLSDTSKLSDTTFSVENTERKQHLPYSIDTHDSTVAVNDKTNIYFTGDIMLARFVETLMQRKGEQYPFAKLDFIDQDASYAVGNFEGSVPIKHQKTPNNNLVFSVNAKYLPLLKSSGFTHLSLANNHSFDYGNTGFKNSYLLAQKNDLEPFGNPATVATSSVSFVNVSGKRIAILGVNATYGLKSPEMAKKLLNELENKSHLQIIYIHWGDEYKLTSSANQQKIARMLAGAGADIIIGHHPHVTQEIELIGDTLVFYSLGNFIFDQYFSRHVQEGLVLKMQFVAENNLSIQLIPVSSLENLSQPKMMINSHKKTFLNQLANKSDSLLKDDIMTGKILFDINLATSSKKVIMSK